MNSVAAFIESGILELYVLGEASEEEITEVERMAQQHREVRQEIENISLGVENYATAHAAEPGPNTKPILMATLDYILRMQGGEEHVIPPVVDKNSKLEDYAEWLNRPDMVAPESFEGIFVKIIGYTPAATTAIIWIDEKTTEEVHDEEHEKFLIVDGTCDLRVGDTIHKLQPGDFFQIPLHTKHQIRVTSKVPCKAILQRQAA